MNTDTSRQSLRDKIDRLQERQFELMREAAHELAYLRVELERHERSVEPSTALMVGEVRLNLPPRAVPTIIDSLSLHRKVPAFRQPLPPRILEPIPTPTVPVVELAPRTPPKLTQKKPRKIKRLIRRILTLALIVGSGIYGWNKIAHSTIGLSSNGQVAGVSTDPSITTSPTLTSAVDTGTSSGINNPVINAAVSFQDTKWKQTVNPDFQIKMQYPENASAISYTPGDNNLWIARDKGFLIKITKFETQNAQSLDDWMSQNAALYKEDYTLSKSTFKNMPAWIGKSSQQSDTAGTVYFVHYANYVYSVWGLNADPSSTKGRWVAHMIESLQFYTP